MNSKGEMDGEEIQFYSRLILKPDESDPALSVWFLVDEGVWNPRPTPTPGPKDRHGGRALSTDSKKRLGDRLEARKAAVECSLTNW